MAVFGQPDAARTHWTRGWREATIDPGFVADLQETMQAFRAVDAEWWEHEK